MVLKNTLLLFASALVTAVCSAADGFLTPAHTVGARLTFTPGETVTLPGATGWSIFNASSSKVEKATTTLTAADDTDPDGYTPGTLRFSPSAELQDDENAFLALGIRADETSGDALSIAPVNPAVARMRTDILYATLRLIPSDTTPDMDTLTRMYPTYEESMPSAAGDPIATAAKLGLCVLQDGYFHISRVHGGKDINTATGIPESFQYEFARTRIHYEEAPADVDPAEAPFYVGNGDVTLKLEFRTFQLPPTEAGAMPGPINRAFRIFIKPSDAEDTAYVSLTAGIGYSWEDEMNEGDTAINYAFDWSSFERDETCEWLYALDGVTPFRENIDDGLTYNLDTLDTLSELAFSATEGGLIETWLDTNRTAQTAADISTLSLNALQFTPYLASLQSAEFSAYADWAADYNVTLSDYLPPAQTSTASTMRKARARTATTEEPNLLTQEAFDAFLLYMDPASTEARKLTITGIVPEADQITLSICGPEGADLATALRKGISHIRLYRSATIDALASATPRYYTPTFDANGIATLVLPMEEEGEAKPFMKAELVSVFEDAE